MRRGECEKGGRDFTLGCCKSLNPLRRRPGRHASVLHYLLPFPDLFVGVVVDVDVDFRLPALDIEVAICSSCMLFLLVWPSLTFPQV